MTLDNQGIRPRLLAALAFILDNRRTCLAFYQQAVAVLADGALDIRADSDLRLQGGGAKLTQQPARQVLGCWRWLAVLGGTDVDIDSNVFGWRRLLM